MTVKELREFLVTVPDEGAIEFQGDYSWSEPKKVRVTLQRVFVHEEKPETVEA